MGIVPFPYKEKPYVHQKQESYDNPPEVEIAACPALTTKKTIVLSGTVNDIPNAEPRLFVNQKEVAVRAGKWLTSVALNDGNNTILIAASNKFNCTTYSTKKIFCGVLPVEILLDPIPELTGKSVVSITGSIGDPNKEALASRLLAESSEAGDVRNDDYDVRVNGQAVNVNGNGEFSFEANLNTGDNKFIFTAQNSQNVITKKTIYITYYEKAPEFFLETLPNVFDTPSPTISGTIVTPTGQGVSLSLYDVDIAVRHTKFSTRLKLKQGKNSTTYHIFYGGSRYAVDRIYVFEWASPEIKISKTEHSQKKNVYKISGIAADNNDQNLFVSVNGEKILLKKSGAFTYLANIRDGYNEVSFYARNSAGKDTRHIVPVIYTCKPPEIELDNFVERTGEPQAVIEGRVRDDENSGIPTVIINNALALMNGYSFSASVPLEPGDNPVNIVAAGAAGASAQLMKNIYCTIAHPRLRVLNCPRETTQSKITMRGMIHTGRLDDPYSVMVYVNGQPTDCGNGTWTYEAELVKGENILIVTSVNDTGERVEIEKSVVLK